MFIIDIGADAFHASRRVTKFACFFISAAVPAELAIYIDISEILRAQTVLGTAMKKPRSQSAAAKSL